MTTLIKVVNIILIIFSWSLLGMVIGIRSKLRENYLNPIYIYKEYNMNYFSYILYAIFANLLSPVYSIYYWVKKLCTVGRKN